VLKQRRGSLAQKRDREGGFLAKTKLIHIAGIQVKESSKVRKTWPIGEEGVGGDF